MNRYILGMLVALILISFGSYLIYSHHAKCEKLLASAEQDFRFHLLMCVPLDNDADCIKKAYEQLDKALQEAKDMGCS